MRGSEFAALKAFVEVAERGSFARAAEALRIAPSTLSQTIRELEERLGVSLLTRTTRRVSLTGAGARLLGRFAPALRDMDAALLDTLDEGARPRGVVRLHAPAPAYAGHVEPVLGLVRRTLPDVIFDVTIDDGLADIAADGFDLVIRRSDHVDSGMVAHDLGGDLRHAVVASPEYVAEHGRPNSPTDLMEHRCILWRRPAANRIDRWRFEVDGEPVVIAAAGPLVVSHCPAAVEAARQGVGVAYVLESYATEAIAAGALTPLLTEFLPTFGGWKLCHPNRARLSAAALAIVEVLTGSSRQSLANAVDRARHLS